MDWDAGGEISVFITYMLKCFKYLFSIPLAQILFSLSFIPSFTFLWNNLPHVALSADSVDSFVALCMGTSMALTVL